MKSIVGFLMMILVMGLVGCSDSKPVEEEPEKAVEKIPEPEVLDLIAVVQEYYVASQIQDFNKVLELAAEGSEFHRENKQLLETHPEPNIDDTEYTIAVKEYDLKRKEEKVILAIAEIRGVITKGEEINESVDSIYTFVWNVDRYKISKYEQR
ncbi:hypothetical protein QTG56_26070 (plasmid) [Rossellomorea sp. AcN35-11]|nr:hypothetical protein [Rossellomorea aquimaris]WJV32084.1 hypothetical protein QTG56_26070 [Rossellomorea sp. AcN35-11]